MTLLLIMLTLAAAPPAVEVQGLDGATTQGALVDLTNETIVVETSTDGTTEKKAFATKEVLGVAPVASPSQKAAKPPVAELTLADLSRVWLEDIQLKNRDVKIQLTFGQEAELVKSAIKGVRFDHPEAAQGDTPPVDPYREQWEQIVQEHTGGDAIVVIRDGDLSVQQVIVHAIEDQAVSIQLDDISIDAPFPKLYGLLFFQRESREFAAPLCQVQLQDDSQLLAKTLRLTGDHLQVTTLVGADLPIPFSQIKNLDFAAGNIQFLDEMTPSLAEWSPIIQSAISMRDLSLVYAPRMNESYQKEPLQLEYDGIPEVYAKGIAVHATSTIAYDLPAGFRVLQMTAGIAPRSLGMCTAKLQIVGDQKILWEHTFDDNTPPEEVSVNIAGVRRLKIIVDSLDGEDFGDVLHLCQARLLK